MRFSNGREEGGEKNFFHDSIYFFFSKNKRKVEDYQLIQFSALSFIALIQES